LKKIKLKVFFFYNIKNCKKVSIKDVHDTGEAFILKREHSALQKMKLINCFLYFLGHFCPLRSGSTTLPSTMRMTVMVNGFLSPNRKDRFPARRGREVANRKEAQEAGLAGFLQTAQRAGADSCACA
jgi:hypothetical protein